MQKQAVFSQNSPAPGGAYSPGIVIGDLFVSAGMGPIDPATGALVGETIEEQTAQVLKNLDAVLAAAEFTFAQVIKTTVHLQELDRDFKGFDAVYREHVGSPAPARTTVGSKLAGILVEIDVMAHR